MTLRIARWRVTTLLAISLLLLLGIPAAASASSASAVAPVATGTGWITLANLSEVAPPVDEYVYSSGSSKPQLVVPDQAYGSISDPDQVSPGGYTVKMFKAGASPSGQPLLSADVTVEAGHSYTVAALSVSSQGMMAQVIDNSLTTPTGKSLVRVIQASINQKHVDFWCSKYIADDAPSGSVSHYAAVQPGSWTMKATGPSSTDSMGVTLMAGSVYTEVVIDGPNGIEIENHVDAAGSGIPPASGVSTGFGGTASHGPGSPLPWLAVIAAGLVLAVAGGVRLGRSALRLGRRRPPAPRPLRM
jgi:Domain of unknown function (DUF4397)